MFSGEYYNFASVNKLKVFKNNYSYSIESKIYFVYKDSTKYFMLLQSRSHKSKNLLFYNNKTFVFSTWIFKCIHFNIQFSNISTLELLELITCIIEFFYIVCCFPSHIHFIKIFIDTFTCF